jgi:hypothetical protein
MTRNNDDDKTSGLSTTKDVGKRRGELPPEVHFGTSTWAFINPFVTGVVVGLVWKQTRVYRSSWSIAKETLGLCKTMIKI